MKVRYELVRKIEGTMDEVLSARGPEKTVSLDDVIQSLNDLALIAETVAHLKGQESAILPHSDKARALITELKGE